jgi:hypothetical protein
VTATLVAGGLRADETGVRVEQDDPFGLVGLRADRVTIAANAATIGDLEADRVDLVLEDVDLGKRTAATVSGTLAGVTATTQGEPIGIPEIRLDGDSDEVAAVASIDAADVEALVARRVTQQLGEPPTDVALEAPNVLTITIRGFPVPGTLLVDEDGALRLSLAGPIEADVVVLEPRATLMDLRAVRVAGDRLVLEGDVELATLLG